MAAREDETVRANGFEISRKYSGPTFDPDIPDEEGKVTCLIEAKAIHEKFYNLCSAQLARNEVSGWHKV